MKEEGKLKTVIDKKITLVDIQDAHRYVDAGHKMDLLCGYGRRSCWNIIHNTGCECHRWYSYFWYHTNRMVCLCGNNPTQAAKRC